MRAWLLRIGCIGSLALAACASDGDAADSGEQTAEAVGTYSVRDSLRHEIATRIAHDHLATPAYFFVGFGYEGNGNPASESHTFASFVRVDAGGAQTWSTISWLPQTFVKDQSICIFDDFGEAAKDKLLGNPCAPVPARNYDLGQTLAWAVAANRKLGIWGPYRIAPELYDLGEQRVRFLESGAVSYLADDTHSRKDGGVGTAFNCMHAVSDLPSNFDSESFFDHFAYGNWGIRGTRSVMEHYASAPMHEWFYDPIAPEQFRTFANP